MRVTVIIPTYKPKDYLWECLDSMARQTFPRQDFEVIIVLNGCGQPWKGQIERFIGERMQTVDVRMTHTMESGVSNARNIGLDMARGEYICFIDDDDYVSDTYIEQLYRIASADTVALAYPYAFEDGHPERQLPYVVTDEYNKVCAMGRTGYQKARRFFGGPCMKLLPASCIKGRRYDLRFKNGEDSLFMFLVSDRFRFVNTAGKDCIYYRRYRENSAYTTKQSRVSIARTQWAMVVAYTRILLGGKGGYSLRFYLTRLLGALKTVCVG